MKKTLFIAMSALVLGGCCSKNYTLEVAVDQQLDGAKAYLSYDGEQRDSVEVAGGRAVFTGKVCDIARVAQVFVRNDRTMARGMVVLEAGTPKLDLTGSSAVCSGTPQNEILNEYVTGRAALYDAMLAARNALRQDESLNEEERSALINEQYASFTEKSSELDRAFFAANKDRVIGGVAMLRLYDGQQEFDSLYNIAGDAARSYHAVVVEKERYNRLEATSPGKMFTDFTIEHGAADGSSVSLSDYVGRGKYVLVDFWASWCGPCRGEMPNLAEVYEKYKGDDFEIVGVAVWENSREDTERALTQLPITWPVIYDAQSIPTDLYGINGIPQIILFGPDGTIVMRNLRGEAVGAMVGKCLGR